MELNTIKAAFDCVAEKQKLCFFKTQEVIEQIGQEIEQALTKLRAVDDPASEHNPKSILNELKTKLKEITPLSLLKPMQKELYTALGKYPKLLEKSFRPDIVNVYGDINVEIVNQIIASHFYQQGLFDVGDCFVSEADLEPAGLKSRYLELYEILADMRKGDLCSALQWASTNHNKLEENGLDIELTLRRLQFLEILQEGRRDEAVTFARIYLAPFALKDMAKIQELMGFLVWAGNLVSSPYSESPPFSTLLEQSAEELMQQFCSLHGWSRVSSFSVAIGAGVQALPTLLKQFNAMKEKKLGSQSREQLPVLVELDKEYQFHSIFVCPVCKEEASKDNPPMRLSCGHVFCSQSVMKVLANGPLDSESLECPSCKIEVELEGMQQLYF